jgi:HlyD family secretion protein
MNKIMTFKKLAPALLVILVILFLAILLRSKSVITDVVRVKTADLQITVEEEGFTRVRDVFVISAPARGYARRIRGEVGDRVGKGQALIQIDPTPSEVLDPRSRAQAQARVDAARASLESAREQASAAKTDAALARKEWLRINKLYKQRMVSRDKLDQALATYQHRQAMKRSSESAVEVARYNLETAQTALKYSAATSTGEKGEMISVNSPIEGRILKVYRRSEGIVQAGQALLDVGNTRNLEVVVEVLSADAVSIKPGTRVWFERWGGKPLQGVVRIVEPVGYTKPSALGVDEQRVKVIADITSPPAEWVRLGHGYRVEARFILWQQKSVLQIPASALFRDGDKWAVFVVASKRAVKRYVRPGKNNGLQTQILSGLKRGERVVAHPDDSIEDGTRIHARKR